MSCNLFGSKCCKCARVDVFPALKAGVEIPDDALNRLVTNNKTCTTKYTCNTPVTVSACTPCKTTPTPTSWFVTRKNNSTFSR